MATYGRFWVATEGTRWGLLFLILLGAMVLARIINTMTPGLPDMEKTPAQQTSSKSWLKAHVRLDKFSTHRDDTGMFMTVDLTIVNNTDVPVKDFEITCVHSGPSGTEIDSNRRTIYQIIKPNSKKQFYGFHMGMIHSQAATSSCELTDLADARPENSK
jgi:hypothetical protein